MYKCWDSVEGERIGHPSPVPVPVSAVPCLPWVIFVYRYRKKNKQTKKKLYWNLWRMARSWIPIEIKYNCSVNCVLFTLYSCIPTNMVYCIIDTVVSKTWTTIFMKCDSTDILHFAKKKQKKNLFTERYSEILSNKLLTWCKIFSQPFYLRVIFWIFPQDLEVESGGKRHLACASKCKFVFLWSKKWSSYHWGFVTVIKDQMARNNLHQSID